MDKYRIDSHKLMYHIDRVSDWLKGKTVYPIYMEISPAGCCNHRCIFCGKDFMKYRRRFLDTGVFKQRLKEMGRLGVKSIMYAGEGEPFLHKDIADIIAFTKKSGIDIAITTNGVLFNQDLAEKTLAYITWIKVSINAAKKDTYAKIHHTRPEDLDKVFKNMAYADEIRKKKKYNCTLGMQIILLPDNYNEIELLAKKARSIGMDYLVVKPYSHHPLSETSKFKDIKYSKYLDLASRLKKYNTRDFSVIFRIYSMQKWDEARKNYKHCLALTFWAYIDAGGDVWACSMYLTKNKFYLGNIYENTFKDIWESEKRNELVRWASQDLNTDKCRVNCRMDEVNRYLWDLTHPSEHVNFI
ncbi:MAG: radical SAM protein [bacterium]